MIERGKFRSLTLVNWNGFFARTFDLDELVTTLSGGNGAGKSTMMKVLTGIYSRDAGSLLWLGKETTFNGPKSSQEAGIGIIHQELNLIPQLTIAENIFLGREFVNRFGKIDWKTTVSYTHLTLPTSDLV